MCRPGSAGSGTMVVDLQELARRMLADYDARTPGQLFGEPLDLTTVQAYALQAEIARLREQRGDIVIVARHGVILPLHCCARPVRTGRFPPSRPSRRPDGKVPRPGIEPGTPR